MNIVTQLYFEDIQISTFNIQHTKSEWAGRESMGGIADIG